MASAQSPRLKRVPEYSVRRIPAFASLPAEILDDLDAVLVPTSRNSGETLYSQTDEPTGLYVLFEGRIKLTAVVATGKTALLRISQAGDLLGLNAVMAQRPYMATAKLLQDSRLARIDRQDLVHRMTRHSELALVISERLASDCFEALSEMLFLRVTTTTLQRLAMLFLRWAGLNGARRDGFNLGYTQAEIGQMIGASRETVTRLMNQLERKGDILVAHSRLKILDQQDIKKIAKIR